MLHRPLDHGIPVPTLMRRVVAREPATRLHRPVDGVHVVSLGEVERGVSRAHDPLPDVVYAVPLVTVADEARGACLWVGGLVVFYHVADDGLFIAKGGTG